MEAYLCGVTISVIMCAETMVVGVLGGGTIESALAQPRLARRITFELAGSIEGGPRGYQ